MALNNYGKALGQLATESVKGTVKGFAMGIKGAAMREMPGITAMYGLHREVKDRANKLSDASSIDASVKEQRTNNIISIEMVRQLRSINNNVLQQTRISALQANNAKQIAMFAEENDREKAQRDKELLDAIKSLKDGKGAGGALGAGGAGAGGKGILGTLFDVLQNASLLEALGIGLGGKQIYDKGKAIFGKGGAGVPTTGGNVPTTGGKPPPAPPVGGGGKVIPFPPGGRGGIPPIAGGGSGGGFGGAGGLLRGAGFAARGILRVLLGPIGWALLAAEVGYEAYKIFGAQGGQGIKPPKPRGASRSTTPIVEGAGGAAFGMYSKPGGIVKGSYNSGRDSQAANQPAQNILKGTYGVGPRQRRSTVGAVGVDATEFIMGKEGFRTQAYPDAGKFAVGHGHSITDAEIKSGQIDLGNGEFIKVSGERGMSTTVTREQADKLFSKDLGKYEAIVIKSLNTNGVGGQELYNKLSQNQKTAILSYAYNTGGVPDGFVKAIKDGNLAEAAATIRNGVATASGEPNAEKRKGIEAALKVRRKKEGDLFDTAGPATSEQRRNSNGVLTNTSALTTRNPMVGRNVSGTSVTAGKAVGPVQVTDEEANAILAQQLKLDKALVRSSVVPNGPSARESLVETQRKENKDKKYLRDANQTFLNQFQSTTQRLLSDALYKAIVVGAYGTEGSRNLVSKQEASAEGYRGGQLSKLFNLPAKTEKILTSAFGKKIGQAYAPMISQLGTAYLEVGARKVGRSFFAGILGNDEKADSLTGQILGNFAKGNKQAATEQLLYGLTGVASGPETIFAKYGFNSSQQGANFLGGYGAAQMTAPLAGMMGGNQPTYTGPYGQGTFGAGQYPMIQAGAVSGQATFTAKNAAGNDQTYTNQALAKLAIEGDPSARKQLLATQSIDVNILEQVDVTKKNAKVAEENFLKADVKTDEYRIAKDALDQANLAYIAKQTEILEKIAQKPVGGGSSAGGTFMSNMGNFAFDLGTSLVASKLTQNIKNPYLKAFANFGVASAANSFIRPMIFGTNAIAGAAAAPSVITASNVASVGSSFLPGSSQGPAGTVGTILSNSGYTQAGSFFGGVQSGMTATYSGQVVSNASSTPMFAAGELVGEYLPYAAAIVKLLEGDVKGAAKTAAGTYAGMKLGAEIGSIIPGVGTVVGAAVGAVLGSIIGSSAGRKPKPAVLRVTSTSGNEVTAVTAWAKDSPPEAWSKFADTILVALLNSAKLMQQQSGATLPFINIGIYVDSQSGISLWLYQEGEATNTSAQPKWSKNFGSIKDFKMGTAIVGMIEFMRDCLKEGKDAITADKLDKATAELKTKNIQTITSDILSELKAGGQYDLTKGVGYNSGTPTATGLTAGARVARNTTGEAAAPVIKPSGTTTPAANLTTSSSAQTTTLNNGAPVNSVVAVGGKTENDNSTTITNINQMSLMNDPWRQPFINTSYQLAA